MSETHFIDGEQAYPIYTFNARWSEDCDDMSSYKDYTNWTKDLPPNRIWNGTGFRQMFKEEQSEDQLELYIKDWWKKMVNDTNLKDKNVDLVKLESKFLEYETWFLTWFCHETFDTGQTDEETLESFEKFVTRKEKISYDTGEDLILMGAEDRWRWHGANAEGNRDDDAPAPCHCKFCKEQLKKRIAH